MWRPTRFFGLEAAWLITGASSTSWEATECGDLFTDNDVSVRELWDRAIELRSPNRGSTIGDDLRDWWSRTDCFTHAPETLRVRLVAREELVRGDELWELRAADVQGLASASPFTRRLDPEALVKPRQLHVVGSEFPAQVTQGWLDRNVPHLPEEEFRRLVETLRGRNWSESELNLRVRPLREAKENLFIA